MKLIVSILGLVAVQAQQQPGEPPALTFPPNVVPPVTTAPVTTPQAPTVPQNERCKKNNGNINFYQPNGPTQSSGELCPQYECASCCNDEKAKSFFLTPEGTLKKYGIYNFEGCSGNTQDTTKQGHASAKCSEFITNNFCMSSCSPNTYVYKKDGLLEQRQSGMKVCGSYCNDFYNACKDEHVCFNEAGLAQYITDALLGNLSEEKNYDLFKCTGAYECKKLSDTRVSKPLGKDQLAGVIKKKCEGNPNKDDFDVCKADFNEETNPAKLFCSRFTLGLFEYSEGAQDKIPCIDPRDEHTVISQVKAYEAAINSGDGPISSQKVNFETMEPCSTGLSTGAIVGIVIGCLVGVGLIAGLVWYFACRGGSADGADDYTQGKQTDPETAGSHQMSQKEAAPAQSIVRSEADYDPSRTASAK